MANRWDSAYKAQDEHNVKRRARRALKKRQAEAVAAATKTPEDAVWETMDRIRKDRLYRDNTVMGEVWLACMRCLKRSGARLSAVKLSAFIDFVERQPSGRLADKEGRLKEAREVREALRRIGGID